MRRLAYTRLTRSAPAPSRKTTGAVLALAQVARERLRLHQERSALLKRIRRIETRLAEIAGEETRLVPAIELELDRVRAAQLCEPATPALPAGVAEETLHY